MQQKIVFATNNAHKLKEIQSLLVNHFQLLSLKDIGFSGEIPETNPTIEENAIQKAEFIYQKYKVPCFADDTGLEVESLNGEPGVLSARYAGIINDSEEKKSNANIQKLLINLKTHVNRKARFKTVIAYINNSETLLFEGIIDGMITTELKGTDGFGYDPVFIPEGYTTTFAEMSLSEKNIVSHRARAFSKFVNFMNSKNILPE